MTARESIMLNMSQVLRGLVGIPDQEWARECLALYTSCQHPEAEYRDEGKQAFCPGCGATINVPQEGTHA